MLSKVVAVVNKLNRQVKDLRGDENTLNNPAQFMIRSDSPATVKVNGWYVRALIRG